jgi:hypothetical protein
MIIENEPRESDEHIMITHRYPQKLAPKHPYEPLANPVSVMV